MAASGDHEEIVKMLLERGADVNAHGGKYGNIDGSALQQASSGGHKAQEELDYLLGCHHTGRDIQKMRYRSLPVQCNGQLAVACLIRGW
jgi:hypothetical protein